MKKVDDEVRTTVPSQNRATATLRNLSSGFNIYTSPLISAESCGEGTGNRRSTAILIDGPHWVLGYQLDLHTAEQVLQTIQLFSDWGKQKKLNFFFQRYSFIP